MLCASGVCNGVVNVLCILCMSGCPLLPLTHKSQQSLLVLLTHENIISWNQLFVFVVVAPLRPSVFPFAWWLIMRRTFSCLTVFPLCIQKNTLHEFAGLSPSTHSVIQVTEGSKSAVNAFPDVRRSYQNVWSGITLRVTRYFSFTLNMRIQYLCFFGFNKRQTHITRFLSQVSEVGRRRGERIQRLKIAAGFIMIHM